MQVYQEIHFFQKGPMINFTCPIIVLTISNYVLFLTTRVATVSRILLDLVKKKNLVNLEDLVNFPKSGKSHDLQ